MRWVGVDQSLANAGWVVAEGESVVASGVLRTEQGDYKGIADSLHRTQQMSTMFTELLMSLRPDAVACEYPAVRGHRTESSLLAASALFTAAALAGMQTITMVNAQKVRKHFGVLDKAGLKAVLSERFERVPGSAWNQHVTDSLGVLVCAREGLGIEVKLP